MKSGVTALWIGAFVSLAAAIAAACSSDQSSNQAELGLAVTTVCAAHCDCPQGQFCYYGNCLSDPNLIVYCCAKPGCPPGRWCIDAQGDKQTCAEHPSHFCASACDCGPAHCCKNNMCVKDVDDPWMPGGTEIGPSCVLGVDATYCCSDPTCHQAKFSYGFSNPDFRCHELTTGSAEQYCSGTPCHSVGDCKPGQSCVDTHTRGLPLGSFCRPEGGYCASNAVTEVVYGYSSSDLLPACSKSCLSGQKCEAGWRPGGAYAVERWTVACATCGDGSCGVANAETTANCPSDCACGDGQCDTSEAESCESDCATCGNGVCDPLESPKLCPADCPVSCGDGSCSSQEVSSCAQDCPCPDSASFSDLPAACGDGVCQRFGYVPENCDNCRRDCELPTDADGDGSQDGCDGCPTDPTKTQPGSCGCGVAETDSDGDGVADCVDACPLDPVNDADLDSICDGSDACLGTAIPESVPTVGLGFNRWALVNADSTFDTKRAGRSTGGGVSFTTADTGGCSCEQIILALGLGGGHMEYGCSTSVMLTWIDQLNP